MDLTWGHFFLLIGVSAFALWEGISLKRPRYDPTSMTQSIRWSLKYGAITAGVVGLVVAFRVFAVLVSR
jgi:hypothetical protein